MISAASSLVAKCVLVDIGFGKKRTIARKVGWLVGIQESFAMGYVGGWQYWRWQYVFTFSMIAMIFSSVRNNGKKLPEELFSEEQQNIGWLQIP